MQALRRGSLTQSLSMSVDRFVDKNIHKVLRFDPYSKTVNAAVENSLCSVGVLVHKHGLARPENLSKILFLYHYKPWEQRAVSIMTNIAQVNPAITITILAPNDDLLQQGALPNTTFVKSDVPDVDVTEVLQKGYDLVVLGSPRDSQYVYEWDALKQTECAVLILYGEKGRSSSTVDLTDIAYDKKLSVELV